MDESQEARTLRATYRTRAEAERVESTVGPSSEERAKPVTGETSG